MSSIKPTRNSTVLPARIINDSELGGTKNK